LLTAAKLKVLIPSACAVALLVGVILQQQTLNRLREENAALRRARQAMVVETSAVTQTGETDELKREKLELLRLRGETGRLRRDLAEQRLLVANRQVTNEIPATEKLQNTFQVHIFARFYSGGDPALETFPIDSTAVVAPTEMSKLLKHLTEATESAELLSAMQVTTRSGQQAQIQATDVQTNQLTGAVFQSGHIVDVLPRVSDDGRSVALTVIANKLKNCPVLKDEISNAQPVLEVGAAAMEMASNVSLWGGQTIAIAKRFEDKKVVLFVTPTLIDPAGNRVHPDTEP
jgi:hypothetical protein